MPELITNKQWELLLATATITINGNSWVTMLLMPISSKAMANTKIKGMQQTTINPTNANMDSPSISLDNSVKLNITRPNPAFPSIDRAYNINNISFDRHSSSNNNSNLREVAELISPISVLSC